MNDLTQLERRFPLPTWQPAAFAVMLLLGLVGIWTVLADLDQVVIASGTVVPQGKVRVVQHLEGGIVTDILVREGERVTPGQVMVRLDLGSQGLNVEAIQVKLDGLVLQRARLMAHVANVDLHFPEAEATRQSALMEAERSAYAMRRREHESNVLMLRKQREERGLELEGLSANLTAAEKNLALLRQQQEIMQRLSKNNTVPRMQVLGVEREVEELLGTISSIEVGLPLAEAALSAAEERVELEQHRFRSENAALLREVELEIAGQRELLQRALNQERRTVVSSPIEGLVKNLRVNTLGGVVGAGQPIVDLVPIEERLMIEARLPPEDIGHISVGQDVVVKITTYDYLRYGGLEGRVSHIAADSTADANGVHFFRLFVETDSNALGDGAHSLPISPGMEAQVDIQIGTRSVLSYLVQPVLKLRQEAFREP